MRIVHYTLIAAVIVAIVGLAIAIFSDERHIGVAVFTVGYFLRAGSVVLKVIATLNHELGRLGFAWTTICQPSRIDLRRRIVQLWEYFGQEAFRNPA